MFKPIYPNRWFLYTVAFIIAIFLILIWQISLYNIEQDFSYTDQEITNAIHELKKHRADSVDISGWKTYRNEKYGFEIEYPNKWDLADNRVDSFRISDLSKYPKDNSNCPHGVGCPIPTISIFTALKDTNNSVEDFSATYVPYSSLTYNYEPPQLKSMIIFGEYHGMKLSWKDYAEVILVEYSPTTIIVFEVNLEGEVFPEALKVFRVMISTLKFFEPKTQ